MKGLIEKRNALIEEMECALKNVEQENRAFTEEEGKGFAERKAEIERIDATIAAADAARSMEKTEERGAAQSQEEQEERSFAGYLRGEMRAMTASGNSGIIPATISSRIIQRVKELCPIVQMATTYNVSGDLVLPYYDDEAATIEAQYVDELEEPKEGDGNFKTITLRNNIISALTKISKSLVNRTDLEIVQFTTQRLAEAMAEKLGHELIVGTEGKMKGLLSAKNIITAGSAAALTADEIIDMQMSIPTQYQSGAVWIMNKKTWAGIRKLKTSDGEYMLNRDISGAFGWQLLGNRVYVDENMPEIAAGAKAIIYGDMSGLALKMTSNIELQTLNELYAKQYCIGLLGFVECDSAIENEQKIAVLQMAA